MGLCLPILLLGSLVLSAPLMASEISRNFEQSLSLAGVQQLKVTVHVGSIHILPSADSELHFNLKVSARDHLFSQDLDVASIEALSQNGELSLQLAQDDYEEQWNLYLPTQVQLTLQLGVGDATIDTLNQQAEINIGVGEAKIRLPISVINRVNATAGVGDISLKASAGNSKQDRHLVGNTLHWQSDNGQGYQVDLVIGVGSAEITMVNDQL